jgi:hypothetical protein
MSPVARETLMDVIQPRFETQSARTIQAIQQIAGSPNSATVVHEGIEALADRVNPQLYRQSYLQGSHGLTSTNLQRLAHAPAVEAAMQHAAVQMENRRAVGHLITNVNGPNGQPTLEMWDSVARRLSDQVSLLRSREQMTEAANLDNLRQAIQGELDRLVPAFQTARGVAANFFDASDAIDAGRRLANGAWSASDSRDRVGERIVTGRWNPDQIDRVRAQMTAREQHLFRTGYVSAWVERLNRAGDNRNVVSLINGNPQVRDEMEAVLGPNRARELTAFMNAERMIDRVRGAVSGNSTTARQLAEMGLAGAAGGAAGGFDPTDPTGYIVGFLTYKGLSRGGARVDRNVAEATARMLTSSDPAVFQRGLRQLAHSPMLRALQDADLAFSGVGRAAASRAITPEQREGEAE